MIVALPFWHGDVAAELRLLEWMRELGGCRSFDAQLIAHAGTSAGDCWRVKNLADEIFRSVGFAITDRQVTGWPAGANNIFFFTVDLLAPLNQPWLWIESDCVPIRASWLDEIETAYSDCGKPFMGCVFGVRQPPYPPQMLNSNAVYPGDAWRYLAGINRVKAFDLAMAERVVPLAANSTLFQHYFGEMDLAPTFTETRTPASPVNTFTLAALRPETVLWHRNKDGTLINCLRRQMAK